MKRISTRQRTFSTLQENDSRFVTREDLMSEAETFPRASSSVLFYQNRTMKLGFCHTICEQELRVLVNGEPLVNLLCSRVSLRELVYGFLYNEGIIHSADEVLGCSIDAQAMTASLTIDSRALTPPCPTRSSGFGGKVLYSFSHKSAFEQSMPHFIGERKKGMDTSYHRVFSCNAIEIIDEIMTAMKTMSDCAREYAVTRGTHCSALFKEGSLIASFEDIGRHNTFDKLAGHCLLKGQTSEGALLTTTGRVSGEMMRKALRFGIAGVASFSGPTDVAISLAQEAGVLLVGYVGKVSTIVYSGMD